jgi:spore maturation protein CgeB
MEPGRTMVTFLNPGRMSRFWLIGLGNGALSLGMRHIFLELDPLRKSFATDPKSSLMQMNQFLIQKKIGLVVNYALNASIDFPVDKEWPGAYRNFFEVRGIRQCFLWADHPQWVDDKIALKPELQALFRSGNQHHFVKSPIHAFELNRILGWPNCHALPCAADPTVFKPMPQIQPDYDVVAIYGNGAELPDWLVPFLDSADPDESAIQQKIAQQVRDAFKLLWDKQGPPALRPEIDAWTERAIEYKLADPRLAFARHLNKLTDEFPMVSWWLNAMYPTYFKAADILYSFRKWQRHSYLAYLSKHFRVGLFGGKWSHVGNPADQTANSNWVDFAQIPAVAARGKIVFDIVAGWDEEGLTAKTFELAACGNAMIHNDCVGLSDAFEPEKEMLIFRSPLQAKQAVQRLLDDEPLRKQIGNAARNRILAQHTWAHRVQSMVEQAGLSVDAFK